MRWGDLPAVVVADKAGQFVVEFGEDAVVGPGGQVAVDGAVGREVVRQVAPGDAGAVEVQDGVEDLA